MYRSSRSAAVPLCHGLSAMLTAAGLWVAYRGAIPLLLAYPGHFTPSAACPGFLAAGVVVLALAAHVDHLGRQLAARTA